MPDIAMCMNNECPSRNNCYRYTAAPNVWRQSYMQFTPEIGKDQCSSFRLDDRTNAEKELDEKYYQEDIAEYRSKHPSTNSA